MAMHSVGLPRQLAEGELDNDAVFIDPAMEEKRTPRELGADRYRLKAPTFTGKEEVEQFIQEFSGVMEVTQ